MYSMFRIGPDMGGSDCMYYLLVQIECRADLCVGKLDFSDYNMTTEFIDVDKIYIFSILCMNSRKICKKLFRFKLSVTEMTWSQRNEVTLWVNETSLKFRSKQQQQHR